MKELNVSITIFLETTQKSIIFLGNYKTLLELQSRYCQYFPQS